MRLPVNGTISRIDAVASVSVDGVTTFTNGSAIAVRAVIDRATGQQVYRLGATAKEVKAVIYAMTRDLAAAGVTAPIEPGARIIAAKDGREAKTYVVVLVEEPTSRGITHFEIFCREGDA